MTEDVPVYRCRSEQDKPFLAEAQELRQQMEDANLSQRGTARALEIDERTMRRFCAGTHPIPRIIKMAVSYYIQTVQRRNQPIPMVGKNLL